MRETIILGYEGEGGSRGVSDEGRTISVGLIEPRSLIRECLLNYLSRCAQLQATGAGSPEELIATVAAVPDVIVLCFSEAARLQMTRPESLSRDEKYKAVPIVVLSDDRPTGDILELISKGARGFIPTSVGMEVAVQAIRLVQAGGIFVPETCVRSLHLNGNVEAEHDSFFTRRQVQVVEAIRQGKPNKIIAYELSMCESTVKVHVRTIMKKLKARNRTQVAYLYASKMEGRSSHSAYA
jgi:DNA-binding NarL/FixJ family response regulator